MSQLELHHPILTTAAAMAALHHRPEIGDMRSAFDAASCQSDQDSDWRSYDTSRSDSDKSYRTANTDCSRHSSKRPARIHFMTFDGNSETLPQYFAGRRQEESPRCSAETCASTVASEEDVQEERTLADFDMPECTQRREGPSAVPATPADFSELFPSHRRLLIRHDDSTLDGNMNLRVDTDVNIRGHRRDMTLFHLRMHELRNREFSLRRYYRDSGREVCHSARKLEQSLMKQQRPGFQRSLSNALNNLRSRSDPRSTTLSSLKRSDSGHSSVSSSINCDTGGQASPASATPKQQHSPASNSIKLEFSNYAQVEVRRTGLKSSKRYEFQYWGVNYAWRRTIRKEGDISLVSYQLTKAGSDRVLAYIMSSALTPAESAEERRLGGWIPPCSMWLADDSIIASQKDVADVVVASGLIALVDDSIKTHFRTRQKLEYVGPKRFINEMFRRDSTGHSDRLSHDRNSRTSVRVADNRALRTPARAVSTAT